MIARGAMIFGLCVLAACSDKSGGAVENDAAAAAFRPPTVTSRADFGGLIERRFHERDANRDDKLQRDELPERAADRILAKWDKDKDGALSATEWGDMMLDRFDVMDLNDDGTVTLTLSRPVKFTVKRASGKVSEEVYTDLTFHELTGLDRRVVSQAPDGQQAAMLIGRATKISSARMSAIIDLLPLRDIKRIEQVITFLSE